MLFIGDDVTDENAFGNLHGPDLGIKIGPGETQADYRVADPIEAARALALLLETRRHWLFGERAVPIERHSMLANGRTVALLTPEAKVSWLCHPKPDSAAIFADLVGGSPAGHFSIAPERGGIPLGQRYRSGTMTVETRWSGLTVTDWLDKPARETTPDGPAVVTGDSTLVRVLTGGGKAKVEFAPRPEFGQVAVQLQPLGDGLLVLGSNEPVALYSPGVAVGGRQRRRVRDRQGGGRPLRRRRAGRAGAALRHAQPGAPPGADPRAAGRRRAAVEGLGGLAAAARHRPRPGRAQRAHPARALPRSRPARSWRRRPPRCPRSWAASATGTTATAGCATPR